MYSYLTYVCLSFSLRTSTAIVDIPLSMLLSEKCSSLLFLSTTSPHCSNLSFVFERLKTTLSEHRIVHMLHICISKVEVSYCSPHTVLYVTVLQ